MSLEMQKEDPDVQAGQITEQLKVLVSALKSRNSILSEENNVLKLELEAVRSEMGGRMFQQRGTFNDLIKTVEQLRETLAKKMDDKTVRDVASGRPLRVVVAEVSSSPSARLAEEMVQGSEVVPLGSSGMIEDL